MNRWSHTAWLIRQIGLDFQVTTCVRALFFFFFANCATKGFLITAALQPYSINPKQNMLTPAQTPQLMLPMAVLGQVNGAVNPR